MPRVMSGSADKMDDIPAGFWKWAAGGLLGLLLSGAGAIGSLFRWHAGSVRDEIREVREELKDLDDRHAKGLKDMDARHIQERDDLWAVINAERSIASMARERNFQRLEQTPTREEMQRGFERLEALIRAKG